MKVLGLCSILVCFVACSESSTTTASPSSDADAGDATDAGGGGGGSQCTAAREATLKPVKKVSSADVSVVSDDGTTKVLYIDGSAGGVPNASKNPAVYVDLATGTRIDVSDVSALESTDWDLALKRTVIYTNGGDGGPGQGGAALVDKSFDAVTAADADAVEKEKFFDDECNALIDQAGFLTTTFSPAWYDYDTSTNGVSPKDVSFVVVGGKGAKYKVQITSFTGKPDGSTSAPAGGYFLMKVATL